MGFEVKILADSISPCGARITTKLCTYPRYIHAEVLTHKMLSKSSASSRAIPTNKLIERVMDDPVIPLYIGVNQKGMQAGEELNEDARNDAVQAWLLTRDVCVRSAQTLADIKVHKQVVNRLIEPWMWITVIITGTEWDNFFGLRDHPAAEPHFQHLARMMREARAASTPQKLLAGDVHLPLFAHNHGHPEDIDDLAKLAYARNEMTVQGMRDLAAKVSAGRCARVSYLTHDGKRDMLEDLKLYERLLGSVPKHASPAEHVAYALDWPEWYKQELQYRGAGFVPGPAYLQDRIVKWRKEFPTEKPSKAIMEDIAALESLRSGNLLGFKQLRKTIPDENIGGMVP